MSKIFSAIIVVLCLLILPFWIFTPPVYAIECPAVGITGPTPNTFFVGEKITLTFTITPIAVDNLKNQGMNYIRVSMKRVLNFSEDHIVPISTKFSVDITDPSLQSETTKDHTGNLYMSPDNKNDFFNNNFKDLCGEISYRVVKKQCTVTSAPSAIPPGSTADIKFSGMPNTSYGIAYDDKSSRTGYTPFRDPSTNNIISVTTDSSGNGEFKNLPVPGIHGDTRAILIGGARTSCSARIQINATLSQPQPGQPGGSPRPAGSPASSFGDWAKCEGSTDDPGIRTAIGCIHTSPAGFIKDFLKFIIGIAGGLAFLMMILGAFQMLTSAGNPDTLVAGRDRLTSAIIGLLFVIFAVLLLQIIGVDILFKELPGFGR